MICGYLQMETSNISPYRYKLESVHSFNDRRTNKFSCYRSNCRTTVHTCSPYFSRIRDQTLNFAFKERSISLFPARFP